MCVPVWRSTRWLWFWAVAMAAGRWPELARVWVTIRALAPTVRGSWLASAAVMLRSVARWARLWSPVLSKIPAVRW
ncbi:MAG TPA: hypothetical protein VMK84_11425 [Streptosporangiaceae bacterium]|nr:hypothetical protein [Streptosporangiaceae bacterium]